MLSGCCKNHQADDVKAYVGKTTELSALIGAKDKNAFAAKFVESFGSDVPVLQSGAADSEKINIVITSASPAKITVQAGDGTKKCSYTQDKDGKEQLLVVNNG